jgi:hypothetical protein
VKNKIIHPRLDPRDVPPEDVIGENFAGYTAEIGIRNAPVTVMDSKGVKRGSVDRTDYVDRELESVSD